MYAQPVTSKVDNRSTTAEEKICYSIDGCAVGVVFQAYLSLSFSSGLPFVVEEVVSEWCGAFILYSLITTPHIIAWHVP